MQHKLNCIGRLHTPISPVSHGHPTALSGARVRACMRGWEAPRHALSALLYAAKIAIAWGLPVRNSHRWGRPPKIPPPIGPILITRIRFLFSIPSSDWNVRINVKKSHASHHATISRLNARCAIFYRILPNPLGYKYSFRIKKVRCFPVCKNLETA